MNIVDLKRISPDNKKYYSAVINIQNKTISIYTNFSCNAHVYSFIQDRDNFKNRLSIERVYRICFLGDHINLDKLPKKYKKYKID